MKAVICQNGELTVQDQGALKPGPGQVLLKVLRCGICGSDLHMRHHCNHMADMAKRVGYPLLPRAEDAVVFGHEFCGEVVEYGTDTRRKTHVGSTVCAVPMVKTRQGDIDLLGLSARSSGAYAEHIIVQENLMETVPNGLDSDSAALTEPMAVALHAVRRSEITRKDVAVVIGCGPVGLGVICMLKARGVNTVIASDFSPTRRELAKSCGADIIIDPSQESPFNDWTQVGHIAGLNGLLELGISTREKLGKLPLPWWQVWRAVEALGVQPRRPIIFECVGVPGILRSIMESAPLLSRIMVVGVCMQTDEFEPGIGINKELEMRFVLGYSPLEYRDALHMLAEGKVRPQCMITGHVGLGGVANAFDALGNPEKHAKILIDPSRPIGAADITTV